jgi:uncharacterized protein (DUF58 family)
MMSRSIHLNSRLVPIILGILIILQLIQPYRGWMIILVGLGGAWIFSYLWAKSLSKKLHLTREMRFGWVQVGDQLEERFTIDNTGWASALWVEIIDHSTLPDHQISRATGVGARAITQWHTCGICSRRGVFNLGPTSLKSSDPFGFFTIFIHDYHSQSIIVVPPVVPLPRIEVAPGGHSGEGLPRPNASERTVSSGSVREYSPGDSLRWIHWRTTAHHNHPYVRIFDGTPAGDWYIFLDLDHNVQIGLGSDSTTEHSIILAASLATSGLNSKRSVGLAVSSKDAVWIPPAQGENQRWDILHALALVDVGDHPMSEFLHRLEHNIRSQTSIILITPAFQSVWVEALLPLMWRGVTPTILLLDQASFGGQADSHAMQETLTDMGIAYYLITKDLLNRPEAHPGQEGQWEWRITPSGRAVPVRKPVDMSWKVLT